MNAVFYRKPWDKIKVDWLVEWWPHYGTYHCANHLGLSQRQVKAKVDKLGLHLLPKKERLCTICSKEYQDSRRKGLRCPKCFSAHRKDTRRDYGKPDPSKKRATFDMWFKEVARTLRYRSVNTSDVDADYLKNLWEQQQGKCFYSGGMMEKPVFGVKRRWNAGSVDKLEPSLGYRKGNIVWCWWACNVGKSNFTIPQYVEICRRVVAHADGQKIAGEEA